MMGFLKKLLRSTMHEGEVTAVRHSSFEHLSEEELEAHLGVSRYGDFRLTDAVRPSYDLQVIPRQGYRHDVYRDEEHKSRVPVLMAAASQGGPVRDLHGPARAAGRRGRRGAGNQPPPRSGGGHRTSTASTSTLPVLKSMLWDFEDLLLNDGCTGIAVLNPGIPQEVQFDEHKLLIVYGEPLDAYEEHSSNLTASARRADQVHHRSRTRPLVERSRSSSISTSSKCAWAWTGCSTESQSNA